MLSLNRREKRGGPPAGRISADAPRAVLSSVGRAVTFMLAAILAQIVLGGCATVGKGSPDGAVRAAATRPIAIRGGVLMSPVTAGPDISAWPGAITLRTADGRDLPGRLGWVAPASDGDLRRWTDPARAWTIREVRASDPVRGSALRGAAGRPVLLAPLPDDADGPLHIGSQIIEPRWFDPPKPVAGRGDTITAPAPPQSGLKPEQRPDRPAPDNPFTYWRWTLLADEMGFTPLEPTVYGELGQLVARHQADLWRLALNRLADIDGELARTCRSLLTQRCKDPTLPMGVATWITEQAALSELLADLLEFNASDRRVAAAARDWIDAQAGVIAWPVSDEGDRVWVALANPMFEVVTAQFQWVRRPGFRNATRPDENDAQHAALTPLKINRIAVDRPAAEDDDRERTKRSPAAGDANQYLQINVPHRDIVLPFGPPFSPARPPGAFFQPFVSTLTLADVRADRTRRPAENRQTVMHVRKAGPRWEVFVECRRPIEAYDAMQQAASANAPADDQGNQVNAQNDTTSIRFDRWYDELRGRETIALLLGARPDDRAGPDIALIVPERGAWRMLEGDAPSGLEVHRRSYRDRWLVRIVLPAHWLDGRYGARARAQQSQNMHAQSIGPPHSILIGGLRTHGDSDAVETGPGAALPWQADVVRRLISLRHWDE